MALVMYIARLKSIMYRAIKQQCDGAGAGGRLKLRPPVESSDLDEKVLTTTPLRDTHLLRIWVES
jgi:hypothetical protein